MPRWIKPLVRISTYEVETLQKRLAEVSSRRMATEMKVATLDAEYELECARNHDDSRLSAQFPAYRTGWAIRREAALSQLAGISSEESGIRDEMQTAFETLKKFEHVAEVSQLRKLATAKALENAQFDELALRAVPLLNESMGIPKSVSF